MFIFLSEFDLEFGDFLMGVHPEVDTDDEILTFEEAEEVVFDQATTLGRCRIWFDESKEV